MVPGAPKICLAMACLDHDVRCLGWLGLAWVPMKQVLPDVVLACDMLDATDLSSPVRAGYSEHTPVSGVLCPMLRHRLPDSSQRVGPSARQRTVMTVRSVFCRSCSVLASSATCSVAWPAGCVLLVLFVCW